MTARTLPIGRPTTSAVSPRETRNWRFDSACSEADADLFFAAGQGTYVAQQVAAAKEICAPCPVRGQCLSWALETRQDAGVWGGLSEHERRAIHKRRPAIANNEKKSAVAAILEDRLDEFLAAQASGLGVGHVARELGTNTTTVYAVMDILAGRAQLGAGSQELAA